MNAFEYQLEILKWELHIIEEAIRQIDDTTNSIKNWTIITWGVSLGTSISIDSLNQYIWLTGIFPLLFWLIDANFRRIQRSFIYRLNQVSDFLNSEKLKESFDQQTFINFIILDPRAVKSRGDDFKSFTKI